MKENIETYEYVVSENPVECEIFDVEATGDSINIKLGQLFDSSILMQIDWKANVTLSKDDCEQLANTILEKINNNR